jgi:signal transduction histidine kinase
MFHKLKKRLIILYGATSGGILVLLMFGVFSYQNRLNQEQIKAAFQKNVEQIAEKVRIDNVVNNTWLARMQAESNIIICVENNGIHLSNYSQMVTGVDTEQYITKIKKLAKEENVHLEYKPSVSSLVKSSVYTLDRGLSPHYGMAVVFAQNKDWISIIAIHSDVDEWQSLFSQIVFMVLVILIGVAALFIMSTLYIGKILRPLEEGHRKQTAFIAATSHELRSPVTVMKVGIASIREDITRADQFLPHIEEECNRLTRLINDMLLLAASDAKTWSLIRETIDMDTLLIESYDMFCTCYNNHQYQFSLDLPDESLHKINGDPERIKQILTILVENAIRYTTVGGNIYIRGYNKKHSVVIEVEDHGKGIPDEEKKQVFERFYQGDQSRKDKKHFGLGLSIAKELSGLHGGDIDIKDTEGGGATFVIKLPC